MMMKLISVLYKYEG
jgi:hypothetical protein